MYRRLAFAPLRLWLTNPRRALLFVAVRPYTMLPYVRLAKLAALAEDCDRRNIPGAFVQCGVWKGGSAAVLAALADGRQIELFDTFDGCPPPTPADVSMYGRPGQAGEAAANVQDLLCLLDSLGLSISRIRVHTGLMSRTVPRSADSVGPVSLLHLDADWYESTKVCMERLYPLVGCGGFVFVDDLGYWLGAMKAVREYFALRGLEMPKLTWVDHTGAFWQKA